MDIPAPPPGFTLDEAPPSGFTVDAPDDASQAATPNPNAAPAGSGFTDDQKRQILDYLPKAKDAADLERFSLELSGGKSKIGNAQAVLDTLKKGATPDAFAFTPPTFDKSMAPAESKSPLTLDHIRQAVGDALMGIIAPGLGPQLNAAAQTNGEKAFVEHVANAAVADYGPEIGGVIDTILHGGDVGNNAAHERAILEGDSEGHPIASAAGELAGVGLTAPLAGKAIETAISAAPAIADAVEASPKIAGAVKAATGGAVYGSGAAGPGNRAAGAVTGGALGAATEAAAPFVAKFIAATKAGDTVAAAAVAKAAHDLGIDLPKFVIGSAADARRASALEQTVGGAKPISDATSKMLDQSEAARASIASDVGTAAEPAAMGDRTLDSAVANVKANRARIGNIYDQAKTAAGGTIFTATKTENTLQQLVDNESQVLGGTKAGGVFKSLLDDLRNRGGQLTIDGARDTRSELRTRLRDEAGVTPDNADRLTNMVMKSVNDDIESGLIDKGRQAAIPLYRKADAQWAQQRTLEDDVLKPFLGKDMDNWGEQVSAKINSDAKGNGTRLARFLSALPEENANNVRASLIMHLGASKDGAQNAAGDAFSLDQFLTNWNQIKGSRNLIFPKDTVQSLDKLAQVAEVAKSFGRKVNRSNTGGVVSHIVSGVPTVAGIVESVATGDPKAAVIGLLGSGLMAARQYGAAKLLASPAFARKLAATPLNKAGATAFWSRPWVKAMQAKNPAIAAEIQAFQSAFLAHANDNAGTLATAAAQPQEQDQQ